jgi:RNA polymerase sigma factor (sigma-70 family)
MFEAIIDSKQSTKKLKAGNPKAFEFLWKEGSANVVPFLRWAGFQEPEDTWQDLWLELKRTKCKGYDPDEGEFSKWLLTVAKNFARDREEERRRWPESIEDIVEPSIEHAFDEENNGGSQRRLELLKRAMKSLRKGGSLNEIDRTVLRLRFRRRLKSPEIARELGSTNAAIRQRYSRTLRKLKREILRLENNELQRSRKQPAGTDSS